MFRMEWCQDVDNWSVSVTARRTVGLVPRYKGSKVTFGEPGKHKIYMNPSSTENSPRPGAKQGLLSPKKGFFEYVWKLTADNSWFRKTPDRDLTHRNLTVMASSVDAAFSDVSDPW